MALDIGCRGEAAVSLNRQHRDRPSTVIGNQHVLAAGMNAQMRGAGTFRADGADERQRARVAIDRVRAHGPCAGCLVGDLVGRVEAGPVAIQRQPRRVGIGPDDLARRQGTARGIHLEDVDALPAV